jgi:hypothetical protein
MATKRTAAIGKLASVLADGVPLSFDETYLPRELGRKIMADNLETEPIFSLLERKHSTPLVEAEYRLEAICAGTDYAAFALQHPWQKCSRQANRREEVRIKAVLRPGAPKTG